MTTLLAKMLPLVNATNAARVRCNDFSIGTKVKAGKFTVVRVRYRANGISDVKSITSPMTMEEAVTFLNSM